MFHKSTYRIIFLCNIILTSITQSFAQPSNDNPCGAILLAVESGDDCTPDNFFAWTDATATPDFPDPGCADYSTGDIWFKFVVSQPSDIFITALESSAPNALQDGAMALYYNDEACDDYFFFLECDDDDGPDRMPEIRLNAQAAGTYYIRFWDYDDKTSGEIEGICITANAVLNAIINDDPCSAYPINVSNGATCVPSEPVSWSHATATGGIDLPGCTGYRTGDVWFSFHLSDTSEIFISTIEGSGPDAITDGAFSVYSADECDGTLTEIYCADDQGSNLMPELEVSSQLPGDYFIRFWDTNVSTSGDIGGICVAAQPSSIFQNHNDEPCGAVELIVTSDTTCTPDHPEFWSNATATPGIEDPPCASYTTGDVWFKFTLTEASDISIRTVEGTGPLTFKDAAMALYKVDACDGTFYFIFCDDDLGPGSMPMIEQLAMPAGDYLIRVWDYSDGVTGNIGGICVAALPTISTSPNDICITAIPFPTIPLNGQCASVSVDTEGATGDGATECDGIQDDDVWYSFVVPSGVSKIAYEILSNGVPASQVIRLYRGTCDDQFAVGCFSASQGIFPDLTGGQIYYIRTFTAGRGDAAQYDICLRKLVSPANDDPCGAITIVPINNATDCIADDPVSWAFASGSNIGSDPGCGSYETGDVWYKFDITFDADIVIRTSAGSGNFGITDGGIALYRKVSDCNQLDLIGCNDDASENDPMPEIIDYDLFPGTYYIRVWDNDDKISGNLGGLCVAVTHTISTKENDQCGGAISFPDIPTDGTCATVRVNNEGATGSINAPLPGFNDDDLWYAFVVPPGANRLLYEITTNRGNTQHIVCLYDGCGSHGTYQCFDNPYSESGQFDNLVEGFTYIISVYTADLNVPSDFNICLKTAPPAPDNDNCINAFSFPEIPVNGACASVSVNTEWATNSGILGCGAQVADLWYSFVVPDGNATLLAEFITGSESRSEGFEIYSGDCADLVVAYCLPSYDIKSLRIPGLVAGEQYFLRVFTSDEKSFEFDLCLKIPPPVPFNDLCSDAFPFPDVPTDGSCSTVIAITKDATGELLGPNAFIYDDEVWFSFVMPQGESGIIVETTPVSGSERIGTALYEDCSQLKFIGNQEGKPAAFYGLTEGETYYMKAFTLPVNEEASFEICISVAPPAPNNDDCDAAVGFPSIPLDGNWVGITGTTLSGTDSGLKACEGFGDDEVWLKFEVPAGHPDILFRHTDDADLIFELYSGECGDLTSIGCYGNTNQSYAFHDLVEGDTYFIKVYNRTQFEYSLYRVDLSVPLALTNDICDQALVFPALPVNGSHVTLGASTALAGTSGLPECVGTADDDVWFRFDVPDQHTSVIFDLTNIQGSIVGMQVFSGSCGDLVLQECFDAPTTDDISGLVPGQTYWIQAYTLDVDAAAVFTLRLTAGSLPPANDDCSSAKLITNANGLFVNPGPQSTTGATNSGVRLCYPFDGNTPAYAYDVWYSFIADNDGGDATITVQYNMPADSTYAYNNFNMQGFEGDCGELTTLSCLQDEMDEDGLNDSTIVMKFFGLTAYQQYYFRVMTVSETRNYAPVDFTIFAEGTALDPTTSSSGETPGKNDLSINRLYPSPAHSELYIDYNANTQGKIETYITDLLGHVVLHNKGVSKQGPNNEKIVLNGVPSGLYFLFIENENGRSLPVRFVVE